MSRKNKRQFSITKLHVAFIVSVILTLLLFYFVAPTTIAIIFLGVLMLSTSAAILTSIRFKDISHSLIVGLSFFFLLALAAVDQLDLVTLSILIAFVIILAIFLFKKEPTSEVSKEEKIDK